MSGKLITRLLLPTCDANRLPPGCLSMAMVIIICKHSDIFTGGMIVKGKVACKIILLAVFEPWVEYCSQEFF